MITLNFSTTPRGKIRSGNTRSGFHALLRLFAQIVKFMEENHLHDGIAYLALSTDTPELYLTTPSEAYHFELGAKLSEFAAPYIERGLLGAVSLIPASTSEELAAYFDVNKVIRITLN